MVLYGSASLVRTFTNRGLDWSRSRVSLPEGACSRGLFTTFHAKAPDVRRFHKWLMVVLLTRRADCSLVA